MEPKQNNAEPDQVETDINKFAIPPKMENDILGHNPAQFGIGKAEGKRWPPVDEDLQEEPKRE
ncbi:MAG TPA: hypothetical protein VLH19_02045 [Patescibacteria group bacterium]|nr:hypothetical protein [Patescibacteria group bacterium]